MKSWMKMVILGLLLFGGFFFWIDSEYSRPVGDTIKKVLAFVFFVSFIVGIFWAVIVVSGF